MNLPSTTNPRHLTEQMYANQEHLATRIRTHDLYTRPQQDFTAWVLDQIAWHGNEIVLDVGCGAGSYIQPVHQRIQGTGRLISADLSLGMLRDVAARPFASLSSLLNANLLHLPLPPACCDVVLANHMLYHVPDVPAAAAEIWRVLRPGGYLLAATNASHSMIRFDQEIQHAYAELGQPVQLPTSINGFFNLENGHLPLEKVFGQVHTIRFESALVFPDAAPAVAYINSLQTAFAELLPEIPSWEAMLALAGANISKQIQSEGEYKVEKTTGLFIAQKEGPHD